MSDVTPNGVHARKLSQFVVGDRVSVTEAYLRSFPQHRGLIAVVGAKPRLTKSCVGIRFQGRKQLQYLHVDFLEKW